MKDRILEFACWAVCLGVALLTGEPGFAIAAGLFAIAVCV